MVMTNIAAGMDERLKMQQENQQNASEKVECIVAGLDTAGRIDAGEMLESEGSYQYSSGIRKAYSSGIRKV